MPPDRPFSGSTRRSAGRGAARRAVAATATTLLALLCAAPPALAWHGHLKVRKVNVGGPSADSFTFKVEAKRHGQQSWSLLPATDYAGAAWMGRSEPANPFALKGAAAPGGPFTRSAPSPTEALFTEVDAAGEHAVPSSSVRDWRRFRVTETVKPGGYRTSVACIARNAGSGAAWAPGLDPLWGAWAATPTSAGGGDGIETTLRWLPDTAGWAYKAGWTVTCTFTNTYRARVKVIKDFDDPFSDAARVDIAVNGGDVDTSTGAERFGDGDATDWLPVDGGTDVTLAERGTAGTTLADYTSTLECRKGSGGSYGAWVVVPGGSAGTLRAAEPGKDYECRFTNVRKRGTIVIAKDTVPASLPASTKFAFTGDLGPLSLGNGERASIPVAAGIAYEVTEAVPAGFTLTSIVCSDAQQGSGASTTKDATATIDVQPGETVTCVFTNAQSPPPPAGPPAGGVSTGGPTSGVTGPAGEPVRSTTRAGTARVVGTTGCVTAAYGLADVRGRQIDRVTFRLNGRVVKTLPAANVAGMFRLRVSAKSLPRGASRVVAEVVFKASSGVAPMRLSLVLNRCPRRPDRPPPFTG